MPIYKTKNEDFFKRWSSEMAYVLGFFAADGSMTKNKRGAHFIEFSTNDKVLLEKIRYSIGSNHAVSERRNRNRSWKPQYRLQIGSKVIFNDLLRRGLTQNKSKTIKLPKVPAEYFPDFLRGYFDGDGNVVFGYFNRLNRAKPKKVFSVRFTSGSRDILAGIQTKLVEFVNATGSLFYNGNAWRLNYGGLDSVRLCEFMYRKNRVENLLFLDRKHNIFEKAMAYK